MGSLIDLITEQELSTSARLIAVYGNHFLGRDFTQTELAESLGMHRTTVSRALEELLKFGWVVQERGCRQGALPRDYWVFRSNERTSVEPVHDEELADVPEISGLRNSAPPQLADEAHLTELKARRDASRSGQEIDELTQQINRIEGARTLALLAALPGADPTYVAAREANERRQATQTVSLPGARSMGGSGY
jgi:DNA-binding transcriptional regulator GbsR (MarR family)